MSDYITNLVERHLGIGELVSPRPQARFESAAPFILPPLFREDPAPEVTEPVLGGNFSAAIPIDDAVSQGENRVFSSQVRKRPGVVIGLVEAQGFVATEVSGIPEKPGDLSNNRVVPPEPDLPMNQPPEFIRPHGIKNEAAENVLEVKEEAGPWPDEEYWIKPASQVTFHHIVENTMRKDLAKDQTLPHLPDKQEPFMSRDQTAGPDNPASPLVVSRPAPPDSPIIDQDLEGLLTLPNGFLERNKDARQGLMLNDPASRIEPVVNVTIGRVEVRAVQSPKPEQAPRHEKPSGVMSLDEYLSRRQSGGDR